jgi:hypothetical protein
LQVFSSEKNLAGTQAKETGLVQRPVEAYAGIVDVCVSNSFIYLCITYFIYYIENNLTIAHPKLS